MMAVKPAEPDRTPGLPYNPAVEQQAWDRAWRGPPERKPAGLTAEQEAWVRIWISAFEMGKEISGCALFADRILAHFRERWPKEES